MISPKTWNFIRLIIFLAVIGAIVLFELTYDPNGDYIFFVVVAVFIVVAVIANAVKKNKASQVQPAPVQAVPTVAK